MGQEISATAKPVVLFCELLKRGKLSIYDAKEVLRTQCNNTAKRHLQNLYINIDRDMFVVEFYRDNSTIYESPVYLMITPRS